MDSKDYYSILGILPSAEDVVVTATYRALAQRYHPDRWQGDSSEAHRRMSAINEAYAVLGSADRRAEYDKSRPKASQADFGDDEQNEQFKAFSAALDNLETRWQTACAIYPDLFEHRTRLARISTALAFAYVTLLLENKVFKQRAEYAITMEQNFLVRFFGSHPQILDYARDLILTGHKAAAKALNHLVDVVGSEVEPERIIDKIERDFNLQEYRNRANEAMRHKARVEQLKYSVKVRGDYNNALELAKLCGFGAEEVGGGIFRSPEIVVKTASPEIIKFNRTYAKETYCRDYFNADKYNCVSKTKFPRSNETNKT